jgi:hypothetical protein
MEAGISVSTYVVLLGPMCLILALAVIGCWTGQTGDE